MKYTFEWFYALISGRLVKPENVYVKCPHCGDLCKAHDNGERCEDCPTRKKED